MIATGSVDHPWIGIAANNTSRESGGVIVTNIISGGPAEKAKMQSGDIIVKIDNMPVVTINDIVNYIQEQKHVGDAVNLSILRDGQTKVVSLHLTPRLHVQFLT